MRGRVDDQAVVEPRDRIGPEARGEPFFDVVAQLCLFTDRTLNPSQGEQGVAQRMWKVAHFAGEPSRRRPVG